MPSFYLEEHEGSVHVETVAEATRLNELCHKWLQLDVIAVDTEFDRTNTYFHNLALIQVFDGENIYLIDPIELEDISALIPILESKTLVKALHSCSEDLEALFNRFHCQINSVFDTQIAASMAGMGLTLGYAALVERILSISLAKEQTKTDWLKRPLSREQKIYAAQDVQFLLPIYYRLRDQLLVKGHFLWLLEDSQSIYEAVSHLEDFDQYYVKIKGAFKLNSFQLNRLKKVAEWRELVARSANLPRTFIFKDAQLIEACKQLRPSISKLLALGCNRASIRKYGTELLTQIQLADNDSSDNWPKKLEPFHRIRNGKILYNECKNIVSLLSEKEQLPSEVLCNKRLIEYFIKKKLNKIGRPNRFWNRWRQELLEEPFLKVIQSSESVL